MSDKFNKAVSIVLDIEKGYVVDSGGPTNFGVTIPTLKRMGYQFGDVDQDGDIDGDDIKLLTREKAIAVYKNLWWDTYKYEDIVDEKVAIKIFDMSVNMGPKQAHIILQRSLRAFGIILVEDGVIGQKTLYAINSVDGNTLYMILKSESAGFYRSLVKEHSDFEKYLNGWLNRAYRLMFEVV